MSVTTQPPSPSKLTLCVWRIDSTPLVSGVVCVSVLTESCGHARIYHVFERTSKYLQAEKRIVCGELLPRFS
jgi:hypothetical protein